MPKKQRQQKQGSKRESSADESTARKDGRPPTLDPQEDIVDDDQETIEEEEGEGEDASQRSKSLKSFLKQVKGQHYRVIEMRVVLVCSFGVFAKLMFSDALVSDEDSFVTHAALTFAACKSSQSSLDWQTPT